MRIFLDWKPGRRLTSALAQHYSLRLSGLCEQQDVAKTKKGSIREAEPQSRICIENYGNTIKDVVSLINENMTSEYAFNRSHKLFYNYLH